MPWVQLQEAYGHRQYANAILLMTVMPPESAWMAVLICTWCPKESPRAQPT
jgi:hypothetical protein